MASEIKLSCVEGPFTSEGEATVATGLIGWASLVMEGYGFGGNGDYILTQFQQEYGSKPKKIIVASEGNIVIGTLVLTKTPILVADLESYNVSGIVVKPDHKGYGVSSELYAEALSKLDIDFLVGNTKEPAAVISRAKGTSKFGMRTFYGLHEVTPPFSAGVTYVHEQYLSAYVNWKAINSDNYFVYSKGVDVLLPYVPSPNGYPSGIKTAFVPVMEAQKKWGKNKTAVMPLLSIKSELLP